MDLDPSTPGIQTSFTVAGEGTYEVNSTGRVVFIPQSGFTLDPTPIPYTVKDTNGQLSNEAMIDLDYRPVLDNDSSTGHLYGDTVTLNIINNDDRGDTIVLSTLQILGTSNPGDPLTVPGEGTWSLNLITGEITFTPEPGFADDPTPIRYIAEDADGNVAEPATVLFDYDGPGACVGFPLTLVVDDKSTPFIDVIIVDNQPIGTATVFGPSTHTDQAGGLLGQITWRGATASTRMVSVSGVSKPILSEGSPEMRIVLGILSLRPAHIEVLVSDGCFELDGGRTYSVVSPIGGTTRGTVEFTEILDPQDLPFGTSPDAVSNYYRTPASGAFSNTESQTYTPASSLDASLTKSVAVTHYGGLGLTTLGAGGISS